MECRHCEIQSEHAIDFPLEIVEKLYFDPPDLERAALFTCKYCHERFLGLTIQHREDDLGYWAKATNVEVEKALSMKDSFEVVHLVKDVIKYKKKHIFGSFDGKYYLKNETAFIMPARPGW